MEHILPPNRIEDLIRSIDNIFQETKTKDGCKIQADLGLEHKTSNETDFVGLTKQFIDSNETKIEFNDVPKLIRSQIYDMTKPLSFKYISKDCKNPTNAGNKRIIITKPQTLSNDDQKVCFFKNIQEIS